MSTMQYLQLLSSDRVHFADGGVSRVPSGRRGRRGVQLLSTDPVMSDCEVRVKAGMLVVRETRRSVLSAAADDKMKPLANQGLDGFVGNLDTSRSCPVNCEDLRGLKSLPSCARRRETREGRSASAGTSRKTESQGLPRSNSHKHASGDTRTNDNVRTPYAQAHGRSMHRMLGIPEEHAKARSKDKLKSKRKLT
ncbi:hypothetical protein LTR17_005723 [Elasticomyces elasticus]|nr:hypothetical protein LTR17_005723 [Elasticomyces elasticus]